MYLFRKHKGLVRSAAAGLTLLALGGVGLRAADGPLAPLTVCEVLADLPAQEGKTVAVLGRYSFRENGRWLGEENCELKAAGAGPAASSVFFLVDDGKSAPKPPPTMEFDAQAVNRKMEIIKQHTALRKFPFGSLEYDRWAIIYGRVELAKAVSSAVKSKAKAPEAARLVYRGDGVILFLRDQ